MELASGYSFPAPGAHFAEATTTNFRDRACSFNDAATRPSRARHAHRRSAAVSEDLSGVDFSTLVRRNGTAASVFDRSPSRSPIRGSGSDSGDAGMLSANEGSPPLSGSGPRVSFVEAKKRTQQPDATTSGFTLAPPILMSPSAQHLAEPSSPTESLSSDSPSQARRLSFTRIFGKMKKSESPHTTLLVGGPDASHSVTTPPEQYMFQVSPALSSPRHSFEEPTPASIDLDDALGCTLPDGLNGTEVQALGHESPFTKTAKRQSFIPTVTEENEDEDTRGDDTVTAYNVEHFAARGQLCPVQTPRLDNAAVTQLAIMDPIESPSILVARVSQDSFSGCSSSSASSRQAAMGATAQPHRGRAPRHRRRRSIAAFFSRSSSTH